MPVKLTVRFKKGRFVIVRKDLPDPDEAKRLWKEGKSAQWIIEQAKKKRERKGERG